MILQSARGFPDAYEKSGYLQAYVLCVDKQLTILVLVLQGSIGEMFAPCYIVSVAVPCWRDFPIAPRIGGRLAWLAALIRLPYS